MAKEAHELSSAHIEEVRRRILNSAKHLLVKHGYKETTIRMIVEDSGVRIGSIYYIFRNKADIFRSLVLAMVEKCIREVDRHWGEEEAPFRYAAVCALELIEMEAAPILRDIYNEGYDSMLVFEDLVDQFVRLAHRFFDGTPYAQAAEDYYMQSLFIKGALRACIVEMTFEKAHDCRRTRRYFLHLVLERFHVREEEIAAIIARIEAEEAIFLAIAETLAMEPMEA